MVVLWVSGIFFSCLMAAVWCANASLYVLFVEGLFCIASIFIPSLLEVDANGITGT